MKTKTASYGFSLAMVLAAISVLFLAGCGGGDGDSDSTPASVAGRWQGTSTLEGKSFAESLTLTQNGNSVAGTWGGAPVSGTVDGNSVSVSGSTVQNGWALGKKFDASVSGETMSGKKWMGIWQAGAEPTWL